MAMDESALKELTIAEGIEQWPQLAPLFLQHRLACFGCDMAHFCTFGDIGAYYAHIDLPAFLARVQVVAEDRPGS